MTINHAFSDFDVAVAGEEPDWRIGAPCSTVNPDLFFDDSEDDPLVEEQAKLICMGCPVAAECLDTAMLAREEYGIWGGMTPAERKRYQATWMRLKGGRNTVKSMRESNGIISAAPHIDRKYHARREAATQCREKLSQETSYSERRDEYLMVLDMIIANPAEVSTKLAQRIGRSATWFNTMKREVYGLFGISEKGK